MQASAASAARIAQLECELEKKVVAVPSSGDVEGLKKQLMEAEARVKIAEQRAAEAAAAAAAAGKQAKDREKAIQDAAAKDMEHVKGEVVSCARDPDFGGGDLNPLSSSSCSSSFSSSSSSSSFPHLPTGSLEKRSGTQRDFPSRPRTGFCCCLHICCCCCCCCSCQRCSTNHDYADVG